MFHKTRGSEIVLGQPKPDKSLSKLAEGLNPSEYPVAPEFLGKKPQKEGPNDSQM